VTGFNDRRVRAASLHHCGGAVFALASATTDVATAPPAAVAAGLRATFAVAAALIAAALVAVATGGRQPKCKFPQKTKPGRELTSVPARHPRIPF
jgi:hypothetical protein